jgi:hypothetical protein
MINGNMLQGLAKFVLDGFARLHTDYYGIPDMKALMDIAQRIDGYRIEGMGTCCGVLERTESDIITILNSREESISELEHIANEAVGVEHVDWRVSFFQERMHGIRYELMHLLLGPPPPLHH